MNLQPSPSAELLMKHFLLLEGQRRQVLRRPEWRDVLLEDTSIGGLADGLVELSLGTLLEAWARGLFTLPATDARGPFQVLRAMALIRTRHHRLVGFHRYQPGLHSTTIPAGLGIPYQRFVTPIVELSQRRPRAPTSWNLSQVIAALQQPAERSGPRRA